jgi:hypothetical protein
MQRAAERLHTSALPCRESNCRFTSVIFQLRRRDYRRDLCTPKVIINFHRYAIFSFPAESVQAALDIFLREIKNTAFGGAEIDSFAETARFELAT